MNQSTRLRDVTVENSTFNTTSYAVFKQMTSLDDAVISGNTFRNIRRGDATSSTLGRTNAV